MLFTMAVLLQDPAVMLGEGRFTALKQCILWKAEV